MRSIISAVIFCLVLTSFAQAQVGGSPYSIFGIGLLDETETTYNSLKGGVGLSGGKSYTLNYQNPALLAQTTFTIFDFGIQYDQRNIATDSLSQVNKGGGLNYLALAVPLKTGKWAMSFGLSPYSNVKYNIASTYPTFGNDTTSIFQRYKGDGGLNQVTFQTGVRIYKQLFVGGKVSYIFGRRNYTSVIIPAIPQSSIESAYFTSERSKGYMVGFGAAYHLKLNDNKYMSFGAVYDLGTKLTTDHDEWLGIGADIESSDTLEVVVDGLEGKINIPDRFGFGMSYIFENKLSLGFDYITQDWSKYESFARENPGYRKMTKIKVGGDYTPDIFSVNSYLKRMTYLFGFSYTQTPLTSENEDINDFGINFGVSLPFSTGSAVNLGFTVGQLGTTNNNLIRENYYKVSLGISFNDQSYGWYRKQRKFN